MGGGNISNNGVAQQIQADRDQATRAKRETVYLSFLDAANAYAYDSKIAHDCLSSMITSARAGGPAISCTSQVNPLANERYKFQGALNQVSIYGSDDAGPWRR